ncbi:hypothetical protein [Paludisphaera rhizosphaerae]|nr:hypothetical protein [Paludisphaera rhizosphaerae]
MTQSKRITVSTAVLGASLLVAAIASNFAPAGSRAFVALGLMTASSMVGAAFVRAPLLPKIAAIVAATSAAMTAVYGWRRLDPTAVVGPVPSSLEPAALGALGVVVMTAGGVVAAAFAESSRAYRFRWIAFGATAAGLLAFCSLLVSRAGEANSPRGLMRRIVLLEQAADRNDWAERQELSTSLAILGRPREAREIPTRPDAVLQDLVDPSDVSDSPPTLVATPWREAVARIAAERRLVLIMEAHNISEHRAWIEQTLGPLREAGFSRYCAEALAEPGTALKARGYSTSRTGVYSLDPRFGNLLRTALRLGYEVDGYDFAGGDFDTREEYQADELARRFASPPDVKMVVHAGHGHVFKHEVRNVGRYMAARLWSKTGVEPFTIWQLSNESPNDVYRGLIRRLGPIVEPVVLAPPPRDVSEALFPESSVHPAVDAVVVHPPRIGREPTDRRGAFANQATRVAGVWRGGRWPVVIAVVPAGEPDDAVALDQVMLRPGETDFELWIPQASYTLRAWGLEGPLDAGAVSVVDSPPKPEATGLP